MREGQKAHKISSRTLIQIVIIWINTLFTFTPFIYGQTWSHIQITDNNYDDYYTDFNDNGWAAWIGDSSPGDGREIYLYDGQTTTQLTNNTERDNAPRINNNGWVTWSGQRGIYSDIFLYDGNTVTQISTNPHYDFTPRINDNGWVVWIGYDGNDDEIFLYNGVSVTQLTDNSQDDRYVNINNDGWVAWSLFDETKGGVFLFDGATTIQLDHYPSYYSIEMETGWVAWTASHEIYLYDGTIVTQITDNDYSDWRLRLNENGWLVWEAKVNDYTEIFMYDGSSIERLTYNAYGDYRPSINSSGWIAWEGGFDIMVYNGSTTTQVTDGNSQYMTARINNSGWLSYTRGWTNTKELWIAELITSLGNLVWWDQDYDGIQDDTEKGLGGITIDLCDDQGTILATGFTDPIGNYTFDTLDPGEYYLHYHLPMGYIYSPQDQGDDTRDSDPDPTTGQTSLITINIGDTLTHWDAGMYPLLAVELISFEASVVGSQALITWETATEMNLLGFNIYRQTIASKSLSESSMIKINEQLIPGQGSAISGAKYRIEDDTIHQFTEYRYYLQEVDVSGITKYIAETDITVEGLLPTTENQSGF